MKNWIQLNLWLVITVFGVLLSIFAPRSWQCSGAHGTFFNPDTSEILVQRDLGYDVEHWTSRGDAITGRFNFSTYISGVYWMAFSPDGKIILTASLFLRGELWDAQTGVHLRTLTDGSSATRRIGETLCGALSPDSKMALTVSDTYFTRLWDVQTGTLLRKFPSPDETVGQSCSVAFSPDARRILIIGEQKVMVWDAQTGERLRVFGQGSHDILALSPDGKTIITKMPGNIAQLWNVQTGKYLGTLAATPASGYYSATDASFSPDGHVVVIGYINRTARLWDVQTGLLLHTLQDDTLQNNGRDMTRVAFSPDGKTVLASSDYGSIILWDVQTGAVLWKTQPGQLLETLEDHLDSVSHVAFSPDGKTVLASSSDGNAILWDAQTGTVIRPLCALVLGRRWTYAGLGLCLVSVSVAAYHLWRAFR